MLDTLHGLPLYQRLPPYDVIGYLLGNSQVHVLLPVNPPYSPLVLLAHRYSHVREIKFVQGVEVASIGSRPYPYPPSTVS